MTNTQILLSFLQFIALVIPAIVILMRLENDTRSTHSPSYNILEGALFLSLLGGLIIGAQLYLSISSTVVQIGVIPLLLSLCFVGLGISVPYLSDKIPSQQFRSPFSLTIHFLSLFMKLSAAFIPNILMYAGVYYLSRGFVDSSFNLGFVRGIDELSPSLLLAMTLIVLFIRSSTIALDRMEFPINDVSEAWQRVFTFSGTYLTILTIFWVPGPVVYWTLNYFGIANLPNDSSIFTVYYAIFGFIMLLFVIVGPSEDDDDDEADTSGEN